MLADLNHPHDDHERTAVALAPDLGERYLDTVYQTNWVQDLYGADVLVSGRTDRGFTDSGTWTVHHDAGAFVP